MKRAALLAVAVAAMVTAGCASGSGSGSGAHDGTSGSGTSGQAVTAPLATSVSTATAAWGIAVMGGSAASHENFWQLFTRPAGAAGKWALVTPAGVADNGGLVMAPAGSGPVMVGVRPSQGLVFSPLAVTSDGGKAWATGLVDAALADSPDSLAAAAGNGPEFALLSDGAIDEAASVQAAENGSGWSTVAGPGTVAASASGKSCGLSSLGAITVTRSGAPLAGGDCDRSGVTGIFGYLGGIWRAEAPALPGSVAGDRVQVLRLTATASGNAALLLAGSSLFAAWTSDGGAHWTVSPALSLGTGKVSSAAFDADGAVGVLLSGGHAATVGGPGSSWQSLPSTPADTAVLAFVPPSAPAPAKQTAKQTAKNTATGRTASAAAPAQVQALATHGSTLTVWQLDESTGKWASVQTVSVPLQLGSSG